MAQPNPGPVYDKGLEIDVRTVSEHLQNIFHSQELIDEAVVRKFRITAVDNKSYEVNFYSLDAIISVGYRVNSYKAHPAQGRPGEWPVGVRVR